MRKVNIMDADKRIVDEGIIVMDNLDDTVVVDCKRIGLINVPKSAIVKER